MLQIQPSSSRALTGLLALTFTALAARSQAQAPWKIVELKPPAGTFYVLPFSVDKNRNVYGQAQMTVGGIRPARWLASTGYTPELVGNQDGWARGSNEKGNFVGQLEQTGPVGGPSGKPVLWSPDGTYQYLEGLAKNYRAEATDVNSTLTVVGTTFAIDYGGFRPFRWQAGSMTELPTIPNYGHSWATAINDAGFIVGYGVDNYTAPTISAGWIWTATGGLQKLPAVGTFYRATGINNTGLVCGTARYSGISTAILWPVFGTPRMLTAPSAYPQAEGLGVNDAGTVVGNVWSGKWNQRQTLHPATWVDGICHDIALEAPVANMTLSTAHGINGRGDVVGEALVSGKNSGFLAIKRI